MALGSSLVSGLFAWPNEQTVLVSVGSVVLGCHREMVGGEMDHVEELGKAERNVEDGVQTTTRANETWCARKINNSFQGARYLLYLEPAAQS